MASNMARTNQKQKYPDFKGTDVKPLRRRNNPNSKIIFYDFVEEYLNERKNILAANTLRSKWSRHRLLQQFAIDVYKKPALDWEDFDAKLPIKLKNWGFEAPRSFSHNYVKKIFDVLRTLLLEAKALNIKGLGLSNEFEKKSYRMTGQY